MLCYSMPCFAVLCCAMLCHAMYCLCVCVCMCRHLCKCTMYAHLKKQTDMNSGQMAPRKDCCQSSGHVFSISDSSGILQRCQVWLPQRSRHWLGSSSPNLWLGKTKSPNGLKQTSNQVVSMSVSENEGYPQYISI